MSYKSLPVAVLKDLVADGVITSAQFDEITASVENRKAAREAEKAERELRNAEALGLLREFLAWLELSVEEKPSQASLRGEANNMVRNFTMRIPSEAEGEHYTLSVNLTRVDEKFKKAR